MRVSVIISTYNQPLWLEKVIWGYAAQTHRDFELVVADDGSQHETRQYLDRLRQETGLTIRHVWHEDRGFRKCAILNRAIVEATSDYLVLTDGDCVPRSNFLAQHVRQARPGYLLSGGAVRLTTEVSRKITKQDILADRATDAVWLMSQGMPRTRRLIKLYLGLRSGQIFDSLRITKATWNGGNSSTWKSALLRVNGFDERMVYGGEDRELGDRLINSGLRCKSIRYQAVCVHLEHDRTYVCSQGLRQNMDIRKETRRSGIAWTAYGIEKPALALRPQAA